MVPIAIVEDLAGKNAAEGMDSKAPELSRLLGLAGARDRAAFTQLYRRTSSHLFAVVLRMTRDRAQAEEVLQEVYVNVWRAARSFDGSQGSPWAWLTSVARNRAIDSLRGARRRPQTLPMSLS